MVWTNVTYLNFIQDYRKCRVLWDVRNPNYTNNNKKRKYLIGLAQKYRMDEGSVKKKIKNLRSAFHREHHRLTNKMKGEEHETEGVRKWFAYDALKFILDVAAPLVAKDYRKCRVLWDVRNPNYTNNNKKRKYLIGLAQKYRMDEGSVKKKIKNLRSAFHREHHRLTNKMKGEEHETEGVRKWFAYDALKFILDVAAPLVAKREEESFSTEDSFQDDLEDDQEFDINTQYIQLPELMPEPERSKSPENSKINFVTKEEDEFDLFGRSMTMQLKKMPELLALDLMQKMQLMVFNAKKQLSRAKNKRKLKIAKPVSHQVQSKIASRKKIRSPSPMSHMLSSPSTSPNYKFEAISPADTAHMGDKGPDFYEYVTAVEPYTEETNEDTESNVILKQLKIKKLKSIDPLEVKQCKVSGTRIKSE